MKPIVGIVPSINEKTNQYYSNIENAAAIKLAGGLPFLLPYIKDEEDLLQVVDKIDGLYLAGGNDVDPHYFSEDPHEKLKEVNPTRDAFELSLLTHMLTLDKPILGVCKGMQMINVALGGDLYQDIRTQAKKEVMQHIQKASINYPSHTIYIEQDTMLADMTKKTHIKVNSHHHQAVRNLGKNLLISAQTNDGIIEAIESTSHRFVLGVQWHPECMVQVDDGSSKTIYETFINNCKKHR